MIEKGLSTWANGEVDKSRTEVQEETAREERKDLR